VALSTGLEWRFAPARADHAAIEASENALAGEGSEWWTAVNYSVINRLLPELATRLP
jgi:hypothetical protein